MSETFRTLAERAASAVGSYWSFMLALLVSSSGRLRGPSSATQTPGSHHQYRHHDVTFLMVFLIQNTQNRETRIVTLKLDE